MEDKAYETKLVAPTWLSGAVLRPPQAASASSASSFVNEPQPGSASASATAPASQPEGSRKWCGCDAGGQCVQCSFLHLQSTQNTASAGTNPSPGANANPNSSNNPWLTSAAMAMAAGKVTGEMGDMTGGSTDLTQSSARGARATPAGLLDLHSDTANSSDLVDGDHQGGAAGGGASNGDQQQQQQDSQNMWQSARLKADISMHQLFRQLLDAHVACLRIATPVDQLPRIEAQVAQASQVVAKYEVLGHNHMLVGEEKDELDQFMAHYVLLLCTFKEQLQQHVKVHAMEAVMACWDLEQSLLSLTGVSPGEGTGATMSDDEDDPGESDPSIYDGGFDAHDSGAFGPLIPTETERTLMERVRQELKNELKNGYKDRIVDVREEILRKRRAGKLPGDTTSVLKAWWHAHSKWPYPTEDEKARLVQETGLQLKQINNWFINQRKRNWHSNPSSNAALKTKRKR